MNYLAVLRRIPDDVILSMATREFVMEDPTCCLLGWAIRDDILAATGVPAKDRRADPAATLDTVTPELCARKWGGDDDAWYAIFARTQHQPASFAIERAFVRRLDEAVERAG